MRKISIILPTRNNEDHIGILLDSIFSQEIDVDLEVLMMDSSEDSTPNIAEEYSYEFPIKIMRVEPEDYNYGKTRNLGASLTNGDFIVFISTDIDIIDDCWLKKLMSDFQDPLVAGVFGRQKPKENTTPMEKFFIEYTYPKMKKTYDLNTSKIISDFFFSNTNSMIRREIWKKIPLPEMLKSEDQEWGKRALLAGYRIIYNPDAVVNHSHNYSLKQVFKEYYDSGATLPYVYQNDGFKTPPFIIRGIKYEYKQLCYIINNKYWRYIPYSFLYDMMKYLGYFLGTKYKMTPISVRRILSKKSNHWDKYIDAVPKENTESLNISYTRA